MLLPSNLKVKNALHTQLGRAFPTTKKERKLLLLQHDHSWWNSHNCLASLQKYHASVDATHGLIRRNNPSFKLTGANNISEHLVKHEEPEEFVQRKHAKKTSPKMLLRHFLPELIDVTELQLHDQRNRKIIIRSGIRAKHAMFLYFEPNFGLCTDIQMCWQWIVKLHAFNLHPFHL